MYPSMIYATKFLFTQGKINNGLKKFHLLNKFFTLSLMHLLYFLNGINKFDLIPLTSFLIAITSWMSLYGDRMLL